MLFIPQNNCQQLTWTRTYYNQVSQTTTVAPGGKDTKQLTKLLTMTRTYYNQMLQMWCEFVTFPLVSWVRCGTWLYRFLIFAPLLTFTVNSRGTRKYNTKPLTHNLIWLGHATIKHHRLIPWYLEVETLNHWQNNWLWQGHKTIRYHIQIPWYQKVETLHQWQNNWLWLGHATIRHSQTIPRQVKFETKSLTK